MRRYKSLSNIRSWRKWRNSVYKRDNYKCILCGRGKILIDPHHILPKRDFPKLKYRVANGVSLCRRCHKKTFLKEYKYVRRIVKKLFGDVKKWIYWKLYLKIKKRS